MTAPIYCANHPSRETSLRCNRCEKPICASCAVHTPTGYRCRECVNERRKVFENAVWRDYLLGFLAAALLSRLGSAMVTVIATWFYGIGVLFFAPFAATVIVRGVQAATRHHRARNLFILIAVGVVIGGLPAIISQLSSLAYVFFSPAYSGPISFWWLLPLIWQVVYLVMAVPAVYTRLSGITIK
ncbi:MAG: hypothetical protein L3J16_02520 [Anaerolineales bacterium]|nr:hypothetical protein [Anaerolineales bacterium]